MVASYGSSGGSSGGRVVRTVSYRSGGSSGGRSYVSPSYSSTGGSSGGLSFATPTTSYSVPMIASSSLSGYESSTIQSSYQAYAPSSESIADSAPAADESDVDEDERYLATKPALDDDAALLTVAVPSETALVTVNGHETTSEGVFRQFMSRGLKEGYLYTYVVKVTYDVDGQSKTESREVKLRPGDTERVVFEPPTSDEPVKEDVTVVTPASAPVVTVVKLHVPADAVVNLAGNDTNGNGKVRTFRTTQLKSGDQWTDYTVRVTTKLNGQPTSKERTITVEAGSTNELTFDFDRSAVAKR